jgi:UDP-glucose 4-epimerase
MRVLVTGGSGNIGQDVIRLLEDADHEPTVYDLVPHPDPAVHAVLGDIRDPDRLTAALEEVKPEGIIHLAGTLQFACESDPAGSATVNVGGTATVLDAAVRCGVQRLVLASSAAVYGSTAAEVDETSPTQPDVTVYGASKLLAERMLRSYRLLHGMSCRTVRFSTVLSSRPVASPGVAAAVATLLRIAGGTSVVVKGIAGRELRHFVHVTDAARGAVLALTCDECKDDLFNIAGGDDAYLSFDELAGLVHKLRPGSGQATFSGASGDRGRINCSRAREQLAYRPQYTIENAIREAIESCPVSA